MAKKFDIDNVYYFLQKKLPRLKERFFSPHFENSRSAKIIWLESEGRIIKKKRSVLGLFRDNSMHDLIVLSYLNNNPEMQDSSLTTEIDLSKLVVDEMSKLFSVVKLSKVKSFYDFKFFKAISQDETEKINSLLQEKLRFACYYFLYFSTDVWNHALGDKSNYILREYFLDIFIHTWYKKTIDIFPPIIYGQIIMKQEVREMATKNEKTSQMRVDPKLVEEAKVIFVKTFNEDYKNINNLGNGILRWFIDSQKNVVAESMKKRSA